jgi:glycerol-3-phosphate acyltransferase PlsX
MTSTVTISVDAMGGDHGPVVTIAGADLALQRNPDLRFVFFGDSAEIEPVLNGLPHLKLVSDVVHCDISVNMSDKPSLALRRGRWKSGMWRTIEAVKKDEADVAVSAGNTGALMAMSRLCLRTLSGMDRPAIAALWPTLAGESVVLDVGATIGADAKQLVDYAIMGGAMARALFEKDNPTVGLLNIGVEEVKGLEEVRDAGRLLREIEIPHLRYIGFIEGDDLGKGMVDVAVTEGFAGNIALKTAEGTARQVAGYLREEMGRTLRARLGYLLAKPAMNALRRKLDPSRVNGGVLLGLNGIVIKSHGGADARGFAAALVRGHAMVRNGLQAKIQHDHAHFHPASQPEAAEYVPRAAGAL